jgi:eukaryotic-like serine/threonine-protein kinase
LPGRRAADHAAPAAAITIAAPAAIHPSRFSLVARGFRQRAGESLRTRKLHGKPLEEATTASLEALKAFSAGRRAAMTESLVTGIPLQKRAVELDPNFALAYAQLALTYSDGARLSLRG